MTDDVVIVGGGPVGLFLACRLAQLGIEALVLEASAARHGSRAIGIHPPSLAMLEELGLLGAFAAEGVRIQRAHAFSSHGKLTTLELATRGGRHPYVLSLPQERTEALLESRVPRLRRRVQVIDVAERDDGVEVVAQTGSGEERLRARWVVGCDGRHSIVRRSMGARMVGAAARGSYMMGDFADDTDLADGALVFLADGGLVEGFPLPSRRRRWVVEMPERRDAPRAEEIAEQVLARTGYRVRADSATMLSAFGVEQLRADRLVAPGRVLAGDAAHVISPFGGQGMNVGWRDAWDLAGCLRRIADGAAAAGELAGYEQRTRRAARRAIRRAWLNGRVGRRPRHPRMRHAIASALLRWTPAPLLARLFTMAPLFGHAGGSAAGHDEPRRLVAQH